MTDASMPRLLVLGESHYGGPESDYPGFTQFVVQQFGITRRDRYFTTTAKLVLGIPSGVYLTNDARRAFWHSVAFYNYIPGLVGATSRIRPTDDQWTRGADILQGVLADLQPHMILVLGKELWYRLIGLGPIDGHPGLRQLSTTSDSAVATMTNHPSSFRFRIGEWQPMIAEMSAFAGFPNLAASFAPSPN